MLSDEEKIIIEKAFARVSKKNQYSCIAVESALRRNNEDDFHKLTKRYGRFFGKRARQSWYFYDLNKRQTKQARLMLLATFWELG